MIYNSLIIFLNRRCTVGCATCNVDATPHNDEELTSGWLRRFFQSLQQGPPVFSGYILWTGGEPFLSFPSLETGIELAASAGYHSEILTSGIWHKHRPQDLDRLAESGKPVLRISLDAEHQEKVTVRELVALIVHAQSLGLEVNFTLREVPGQSHSPRQTIQEIRKQLPQFYEENHRRSRWIHQLPHIPVPSKPDSIAPSEQFQPEAGTKSCSMAFRDLVIGADGWVYPCCGFFSIPSHRKLAVADPLKEKWKELAEEKKEIVFYGPCHRCIAEKRLTIPNL